MRTQPTVLVLLAATYGAGCAPPPNTAPPAHEARVDVASSGLLQADAHAPEGPAGPADELRAKVLASSRAYDVVRSVSDEVGSRLSGSPGGEAAVAWGLRTLGDAGLSSVRAEPVKEPRWERGEAAGEILAPYRHELALAALGGSVGTDAAGLEGEVVEAASLDELAKLGEARVKGKIVFFNAVMERTRDGSGYGKAVLVRVLGAIRAAKLGALGVVIRSIGTDGNRLPHTGAMRYEEGTTKIPAAALAIPDADTLHRVVAQGNPVRLRLKLGARTLPDADGANVVGDVPGSEAPKEIVLLGAHLDSWDLGRGAIDDGAGCGIIIEAARQIAALPRRPRRTVRVVLFANEENGLAGAKAYAKAHEDELGAHVVAIEADLGAGRVYETRFLGDPAARGAFLSLTRHVLPLGVTFVEGAAEGGADLSPLRPVGVPFIDLRQDMTGYFDFHHTANDTLDKIHKEDLDQATAAFATMAFAVADMKEDLGRIPQALRDSGHFK